MKNQGVVAVFKRDRFDRYSNFARIGDGSLGGKGRGLAFIDNMVKRYPEFEEFENARVEMCIRDRGRSCLYVGKSCENGIETTCTLLMLLCIFTDPFPVISRDISFLDTVSELASNFSAENDLSLIHISVCVNRLGRFYPHLFSL